MKKVVKIEKFVKGIYTKYEIRYILAQGWIMVTDSAVPVGCARKYTWQKQYRNVLEVKITSSDMMEQFTKACEKRAKVLRKKMENVDVEQWCKDEDARVANHARLVREDKAIREMLFKDGFKNSCYPSDSLYRMFDYLRRGSNSYIKLAHYSNENGISVSEYYSKYSSSCPYTKTDRHFTFTIRKGWHLFRIGGLLTFIKGTKIEREGMACEWIEQGREISDIRTVKGFLVRGEHIEAKTLKEAKAINAEHRAMQLARLLSARKKAERRAEQKANGTLRITFQDSLNAGNCRPGTQEFKHQYEAAIGHEAKDISIADLRKYGKQFGVEYYAEKAIQYALNH
jgi:hypothetical protein